MKSIIFFLLIGTSFLCAQTKNIVHLSFNVNEEQDHSLVKHKSERNGKADFYIGNEYFEWNGKRKPEEISASESGHVNMLNICSFTELAWRKRKELIRKEEKTGVIHILTNDKVFDKIYLYEKSKSGVIKKYEVTWIEAIID